MSGTGWDPVHHVEAEDPDNEPAKGPTVEQREGRKPQAKSEGAPVGLTLNLPPDFISAMWGYGDNVLRLAIAVEENTKALQAMMKQPKE